MKSSYSKRGSVGVLKRLNYSQAEVAKTLRVTKGFVKYWWNRSNIEDKPKSGRPLKTGKSVSNQVIKRLKMKVRQSTRKIGRELHLAPSTVRNIAGKYLVLLGDIFNFLPVIMFILLLTVFSDNVSNKFSGLQKVLTQGVQGSFRTSFQSIL